MLSVLTTNGNDDNNDYNGTSSTINYKAIPQKVSILSAKAFGSMLSSPNSSHTTFKPNPFWKQRVCYTGLPFLLRHVKNDASAKHDDYTVAVDLILANLGCCIPILALGEDNIANILQRITHRLGNAHDVIDSYGIDDFATLALAALVKFLASPSSDVVSAIFYIIHQNLIIIISILN